MKSSYRIFLRPLYITKDETNECIMCFSLSSGWWGGTTTLLTIPQRMVSGLLSHPNTVQMPNRRMSWGQEQLAVTFGRLHTARQEWVRSWGESHCKWYLVISAFLEHQQAVVSNCLITLVVSQAQVATRTIKLESAGARFLRSFLPSADFRMTTCGQMDRE